jgi:hypothetical protein
MSFISNKHYTKSPLVAIGHQACGRLGDARLAICEALRLAPKDGTIQAGVGGRFSSLGLYNILQIYIQIVDIDQ